MKKAKVRGIFSGARGQRIFNILYSVGASIVILGALFKILHLWGADEMLIIGMGTEALIFFLSAFDEQQMGSGEEAHVAANSIVSAPEPVDFEGIITKALEANAAKQQPVVVEIPKVVTEKAQEATDEYVKQLEEIKETLNKQLLSAYKASSENDQLTETIKQLNATYERMLDAMQQKS